MIPVAGSAYTYGYATLGELVAWIIGWDLILEYALGAAPSPAAGAGTSSAFFRISASISHPFWPVHRARNLFITTVTGSD